VRSTTLLFTPRCTSVQILGLNLGQTRLHRNLSCRNMWRHTRHRDLHSRAPPCVAAAVPPYHGRPRGPCTCAEALASTAHAPQATPWAGSRAGHEARAHSAAPAPSLSCTPAEAGRTNSTASRAPPRCNSLASKHLVARAYKRGCTAVLNHAGMPPPSQATAPLTPLAAWPSQRLA
jgi:hypothetical protein